MGDSVVIYNAGAHNLAFENRREELDDVSGSDQHNFDDFFEEVSDDSASVRGDSQVILHFADQHCHDIPTKPVNNKLARQVLWVVSLFCSLCMVIEALIGYVGGNLFIATDATRLLPDLIAYLTSLFTLSIAEWAATKRYNFGYRRAEIIGALTSVLIIFGVTGHQILSAITRFLEPEFKMDSHVMMITSAIGFGMYFLTSWILYCKGYAPLKVHRTNSNYGGGNSSGRPQTSSAKQDVNVEAAAIHFIRGLLHSLGGMSTALVLQNRPEWTIADLICTFLFSSVIILTTIPLTIKILRVLIEGVPPGIQFEQVRNLLQKREGVLIVHNLRIWALSMTSSAISCHLAIEPGSNHNNIIVCECTTLLKRLGFMEVTIQIEEFHRNMLECRCCLELN